MKQSAAFLSSTLILLLAAAHLGAADFFTRGEEAFMANNPADAAPLLEVAVQENPGKSQAYIYLGIAYMQLDKLDRAATALLQGIENADNRQKEMWFNLGMIYQRMGSSEDAQQAYAEALSLDPDYAKAYLNRGNLRVRTKQYADALQDYQEYIGLEPNGEQSDDVRRMIAALQDEIAMQRAEAERERIAQQEAERQAQREAEEQRQREAERQRQAEQRRQELLSSVLDSLEGTGNVSDQVGAEDEEFDDFDFELGRED